VAPDISTGQSFDSTLAAAKVGAEWAFAVLYRDLNPRLLRYFAARVGDDAEDLAVETWLATARRIGDFEGGQPQFWAWIFTVAHSRLVQHWRDVKRMPPTTGGVDLAGRAGTEDVESVVLGRISGLEATSEIIRSLSPDQAEVILLRVLGGLGVDEVAQILDKQPGTVRVLQHKALRRLATSRRVLEAVNAGTSRRD